MAQPLSETLFRHSALEPGPKARIARDRAFRELRRLGLSPAPALVADLVTALVDGRCAWAADPGRPAARHAARCMATAASAANGSLGSPIGQEEIRTRAAIRFLVTWFAAAPRGSGSDASLERLEREAMGVEGKPGVDAGPWVEWRASEELAFEQEGSPAFRHALAELRMGSASAFGATDERIWFVEGRDATASRGLEITSARREGLEGEPMRDPSGVFREIARHGLPPNPDRICAADLAILAARNRGARALLAAKLADSSLMVRFGSVPRPSLRRPRVLLVVALLDSIAMHEQRPGSVVPDIEPLRETLLWALPACVRSLEQADVDFELEIRREGPLARGRLRIRDTRNRHRRVRPELRSMDLLRDRLAREAAWLFRDDPVSSSRNPPPDLTGHDAAYLIGIEGTDDLAGLAWTGRAVIRPAGDGQYLLQAGNTEVHVDRAVDIADPRGIGSGLSSCFADAAESIEHPDAARPEEEGVILP